MQYSVCSYQTIDLKSIGDSDKISLELNSLNGLQKCPKLSLILILVQIHLLSQFSHTRKQGRVAPGVFTHEIDLLAQLIADRNFTKLTTRNRITGSLRSDHFSCLPDR